MGAEAWGLAFLAGSVGTLLGGTQAFIIYGFLGILVAVMDALGMDTAYLNENLVNLFFMPCVIFNGAGFATAYAAAKHNIKGYEVGRSLAFTNDPKVLLMGGIGGVLGYTIYVIATGLRVPMDIGSLSVVIMGIVGRLLFYRGSFYNKKALLFFSGGHYKDLVYPILMALVISCAMACFAKDTGLYTIGFSISAVSLIFAFTDPVFPATHHITLVAGYGVMQTGSIAVGIICGVVSHVICLLFTMVFNSKCGTHIDPPGVAIGICSLIIFVFL